MTGPEGALSKPRSLHVCAKEIQIFNRVLSLRMNLPVISTSMIQVIHVAVAVEV